jgi:hypothetical protein
MFSAISKAAGFLFWGSDDKGEEAEPVPPEATKSEPDSLGVQGKVTSIHNGYGVIDKEIYFSFECVVGGVRPKVGDVANVLATRKSVDDGWKAEQVSVVTGVSWDAHLEDNGSAKQPVPEVVSETVVGMVTGASSGQGLVNNDISFEKDAVTPDYIPYRGDWVTCDIERNTINGTCHAIKIAPLRTMDFNGEINSVLNGFGYINRDIYVQFDACRIASDCEARRGEKVCGKAIESNQGKCNWRAICIMAVSSQSSPGAR